MTTWRGGAAHAKPLMPKVGSPSSCIIFGIILESWRLFVACCSYALLVQGVVLILWVEGEAPQVPHEYFIVIIIPLSQEELCKLSKWT